MVSAFQAVVPEVYFPSLSVNLIRPHVPVMITARSMLLLNQILSTVRMDNCVYRVGSAKYVTKLDLLKGYRQP